MKLLFLLVLIYSCKAAQPPPATDPPTEADPPTETDPPGKTYSPKPSAMDRMLNKSPLGTPCRWPYPTKDVNSLQPVFLTKNKADNYFQIAVPINNDGVIELHLQYKQKLLVMCPKTDIATELRNGQCSWNNLFASNSMDKNLDSFKCHNAIEFEKVESSEICQERYGNIIKSTEIGFKFVTADRKGMNVIIVKYCFDHADNTILHTTHRIFGGLKLVEKTPEQIKLLKRFSDLNVEPFYYDERKQHVAIIETYSMKGALELYGDVLTDDILVLVRLIPPEDTIVQAEKTISDEPKTLVLMWESAYKEQWVKVEQLVRETASKLDGLIQVTTGTYGVEELKEQKLVIGERPVPQFIWKMIKWKTFCVIFVVNNRRQGGQGDTNKMCSSDICTEKGWTLPAGVSCCFMTDFKEAVRENNPPPLVDCEPLQFPKPTPSQ